MVHTPPQYWPAALPNGVPIPPLMPHRLPCYLIMSSSEGEQVLEVDGQQWALLAGRLMVIPPGMNHRTWSDIPRRTLWVRFDVLWQDGREHRSEIRTCEPPPNGPADYMQPSPQEVWGVDLPQQPSSGLIKIAHRLVEHWHGAKSIDRLEANHLLATLLAKLLQPQLDQAPPVVTDDRIAHAERIALTMLDQPFGVADFAAAAQLSRTRFADVYRQLRGEAPSDFLDRHRLERAPDYPQRDRCLRR